MQAGDGLALRRLADEALDDAALEQVLFDDLGGVVRANALVEDAVGVHRGDRADGTGAEAPGFDDLDLALETLALDLLAQGRADLQGAGGDAAAAGTQQ